MYDFSAHLFENEKILYQGRAVPGKGDKGIGGSLFLIGFSLLMLLLMIWSIVTKTGDGAYGLNLSFIIIFLAIVFFLALGVWNIIYNVFLKKKCVVDDFYCLTNMRAMKYEEKKQKLVFGYLAYYDDIRCINVKNGYGDLYMGIIAEEKSDSAETAKFLKDVLINPNPENMPFIQFQSIEKPNKVKVIAKKAREDILEMEKNKKSNLNDIKIM